MRARYFLLVPLMGAMAACKGSSDATSPNTNTSNSTQGTVVFQLDAATCANNGDGPYELYIDGTLVATSSIVPGGTSSVIVAPGTHSAQARDVATGYQWSPQSVTVGAGGVVNVVLICE